MNSKNSKILFVMASVIVFAAVPVLAQIPTARVTGGVVQGVVKDGIASFKGIPFAAPPVGDLRWKAPQPVIPWQGVKKAEEFAPAPMQNKTFLAMLGHPRTKVSEDCLYLNVWTGAKKAGEKRPVMVWIYGGGFMLWAGSDPKYDGTNLAKKGVVLVSIAYRVGPLGFLAHPELSKESGKGSGCYGIQDQIAALKWIKQNIAQFGGNPSNVTIFGESAGGISVEMLVSSPMAKDLFHRAISQSGGAGSAHAPLKMAEERGRDYLRKLGANDIKAARALSAEEIQKGNMSLGEFMPVADGETITVISHKLYRSDRYNNMPILVGTNSDEGAMFVMKKVTDESFEDRIRKVAGLSAEAILKAYPHATDAEANKSAKDIIGDFFFAWRTLTWASLHSRSNRNKAFVYYFDHRTPKTADGANHGDDEFYVFGNLDVPAAPSNKPEDRELSDLMISYWVNFARNGDPNGPGLPIWPAFDEIAQKTMVFDKTPGAKPHPNMDKIRAWDAYSIELMKEGKGAFGSPGPMGWF
jgi:para-nitrobenzyl esterase